MKKIACISDTHSGHCELEIPFGDIICCCGDFCDNDVQLIDFLEWFSDLDFNHKVLIAGNHDRPLYNMGYNNSVRLCKEFGIHYLQDSGIWIDGLYFWGTPWSVFHNGGVWQEDELELEAVWNEIPDCTNVLLTHTPPKDVLDNVPKIGNVGSTGLKIRIDELVQNENLKLHAFGHIHSGYGIYINKSHTSVNGSALYKDDKIQIVYI